MDVSHEELYMQEIASNRVTTQTRMLANIHMFVNMCTMWTLITAEQESAQSTNRPLHGTFVCFYLFCAFAVYVVMRFKHHMLQKGNQQIWQQHKDINWCGDTKRYQNRWNVPWNWGAYHPIHPRPAPQPFPAQKTKNVEERFRIPRNNSEGTAVLKWTHHPQLK